MTSVQILFASIAAITAIVGIAVPIWRAQHRYGLRWATLEPKSMMDIAEDVADDLLIQYKGQNITNLTKYQFILHNIGLTPLDDKDIIVPLKWTGPGTLLSVRTIVSRRAVTLEENIQGNYVEFKWPVFNQRCMALIEILCEGGSPSDTGSITGQIRNIPSIEEKRISVFDEDEVLKRMEQVAQLTVPRFLRRIQRVFINKFVVRAQKWMPTFVILLVLGQVTLFYSTGEVAPYVLYIIAPMIVALVVVAVFVLSRNPYDNLVKKVRERKNPV